MNRITAYTDGSCRVSYPQLGGFGVYIKTSNQSFKIKKGFCFTKTGRMELMAILYCFKSITNKSTNLTIYSDSQYAIKSCNEWMEGWEQRGWEGVKNVDILKQLLYELRQFNRRPLLKHVKGHQDPSVSEHTYGNNIADQLASYRLQNSFEVDLPLDDLNLNEIEKLDFYEKDGKTYYKKELI